MPWSCIALSLVGLAVLGPACKRDGERTDIVATGRSNAPAPDVDPLRDPATTFVFRVVDSNWEIGGATVDEITTTPGALVHTFPRLARREGPSSDPPETVRWFQTSTAVPTARIEELRRRLLSDFRPLAPHYRDGANTLDGVQTTFVLEVGAHVQRVHCSNAMPPELASLRAYVEGLRLGPGASPEPREISEAEAQKAASLSVRGP